MAPKQGPQPKVCVESPLPHLWEAGDQRKIMKAGSEVYFSRLRGTGLRIRDSTTCSEALCKSKEALRSIKEFVISPPS